MLNLSSILNKSFETWKSNLIITAVYVLQIIALSVITVILGVGIGIFVLVALGIGATSLFDGNIEALASMSLFTILLMAAISLIFFILIILIYTFFIAGLIGMCKNAVLKSKTNFSDFIEYGKKYFKNTLIANIAVVLITILVGIVFGIIVAVAAIATGGIGALNSSWGAGGILLISLIVVLYLLTMIIASTLRFVIYGTAIEEKSAFYGIKLSFQFIKNNLKIVILLAFIYSLFSITNLIVEFSSTITENLILTTVILLLQFSILIISVLFWEPFMMISFCRCYIEGTSEEMNEEVCF